MSSRPWTDGDSVTAPVSTDMREGDKNTGGTDSGSEASTGSSDRPHPPSFYCPISCQCMHDPVILTDGHTYERRHIMEWLRNSSSSPVTGVKLESTAVISNHTLRNAIEEYFEHVLCSHRQAIRQATVWLAGETNFSDNEVLRQTIDSLMQCSILVNADLSVEDVLAHIMKEAKALLGTEVASVFLVDREKRELYSTVNSTGGELRIPMDSGVAGHVALSGSALIINDAYADSRFNTAVDAKTGFRTRNILCVPIRASKGSILGVAQLINKTDSGILKLAEGRATKEDHDPLDFTSDDLQFFQVLALQAGAAVDKSRLFESVPQKIASSASGLPTTPIPHDVVRSGQQNPEVVEDGGRRGSRGQSTLTNSARDARPTKIPRQDDNDAVSQVLEDCFGSWEMDVVALEELTEGQPLSTLSKFLFEKTGLIDRFDMNRVKLDNFLIEIERGYPETNQYHNRAHAASVLHIAHALLHLGDMAQATSVAVEDVEVADDRRWLVILSVMLAAITHDYEHQGVNNDFLVKTAHSRATRYNDRSPNENHHVAASFALLKRPEYNFLECLNVIEFTQVRKLVIELVLATDMAENNRLLSAFKDVSKPSAGDAANGSPNGFRPSSPKEGSMALQMVLKCADLGHLSLSWTAHLHWVRLLESEFFAQGDEEKRAGFGKLSFLMDRERPGVTQTQVGFLDFVALPLFRCLSSAFPTTSPMCAAVEKNYSLWKELEAPTSS